MKFVRVIFIILLSTLNLNATIKIIDGIEVSESVGKVEKINNQVFVIVKDKRYSVQAKSKYITDSALAVAFGRSDVKLNGNFHEDVFDAVVIETPPLMIGFLAPKSCIENHEFNDCNLQKYNSKEELALYSNGTIYQLDFSAIKKSEINTAIIKNNVYLYGKLDADGKVIVQYMVVYDYILSYRTTAL